MFKMLKQKFAGSKLGMKTLGVSGAALAVMALTAGSAMAAPIDFTGTDLGITTTDLTTSSTSYVKLYGPFILLVLALIFAPRLIDFLFYIIGKARRTKS
ncbi:hypothetical protein [Paenibacillus ehimensis]|uniref:hypothetical protein n=1 Tax=Paenibacillus ehimensis TaxID=79264 RepID=UPI000FDC48A7|nr:hypothetical protein [Paenibacillus ehimensis]